MCSSPVTRYLQCFHYLLSNNWMFRNDVISLVLTLRQSVYIKACFILFVCIVYVDFDVYKTNGKFRMKIFVFLFYRLKPNFRLHAFVFKSLCFFPPKFRNSKSKIHDFGCRISTWIISELLISLNFIMIYRYFPLWQIFSSICE